MRVGWFTGLAQLGRVLRNRDFALYTLGSTFSLIGTWMQRITVGWLTWELTESAAWLGLIAFADLFPVVIVGPVAGAFADRLNRMTIARVTQLLGMLQAIVLVATYISGDLTIWLLFFIMLFQGIITAFNQPARLALIHSLVGRDLVGSAVAINSIAFNLARFIGPAIAGILIATVGMVWSFALNAASFAVFLGTLLLIHMEPQVRGAFRGALLTDIADGIRYAVRHRGIGPIFLLMLAMGAGVRPVAELLPGFAAQIFSIGPIGLAALTSSMGIGAIAGSVWIGSRSSFQGLTRCVTLTTFGAAVSVFLFAWANTLWLGLVFLLIAGFFMVATGVGAQTLVQISVSGNMRGRVLSLHGLIFRGTPAIGAVGIGVLSELIGLRWPIAIACIFVALISIRMFSVADGISQTLEAADNDVDIR